MIVKKGELTAALQKKGTKEDRINIQLDLAEVDEVVILVSVYLSS
jgi:hypothetical protein